MAILNSIPQESVQQHFEQWENRLTNRTAAPWDYPEGDRHFQHVSN